MNQHANGVYCVRPEPANECRERLVKKSEGVPLHHTKKRPPRRFHLNQPRYEASHRMVFVLAAGVVQLDMQTRTETSSSLQIIMRKVISGRNIHLQIIA
eukprot:2719631-Pleurochrysis_carterae.AAC.2